MTRSRTLRRERVSIGVSSEYFVSIQARRNRCRSEAVTRPNQGSDLLLEPRVNHPRKRWRACTWGDIRQRNEKRLNNGGRASGVAGIERTNSLGAGEAAA